ncbi:SCO3374 family protein [Streptomyces sp. NPDC096205]|uniref:SCO3374 family protein n=1 Tax=Streptomyces sp. NPDC096205 TaxID=3366081 RepID=UPI00380ED22F
MVGAVPPATPAPPVSPTVPLPRRAPEASAHVRRWYENELGWATVPGDPVLLSVGLRFDVLDVPMEAGIAALRHLRPGSPVAVCGGRMWLLAAPGSAEELPGLLDWLEWGALSPDVMAIGPGGLVQAPPPAEPDAVAAGLSGAGARPGRPGALQGAAWLRPPVPGCEVEASLPTLSALGGVQDAPDLVRVVETVATQCHRIRLRRAGAQPLAFS